MKSSIFQNAYEFKNFVLSILNFFFEIFKNKRNYELSIFL